MNKILATLLTVMLWSAARAGETARVLFIGNSYTYVNDLPLLLKDLAASTGDVVIYDSHLIGGYTLQQHSTNATTIGKIAAGGWDYVVLQEQSQLPSFPDAQVAADVYPSARKLDSIIRHHNPCAETIFYNTWGRKNGDASNCASWPPVCTYAGMDSLLRLRYGVMAAANNAIIAPVGPVWRQLRKTAPGINLYDADESHPAYAGSYAAACCFYSVIFRNDPTGITFNGRLSGADASAIRLAAKDVAFDSLSNWHVGSYDPVAAFSHSASGAAVSFSNTSQRAGNYLWLFGNGQTSTTVSPMHIYASSGTYQVKLIASICGFSDTAARTVTVTKAAGVSAAKIELPLVAYVDAFGTLRLKSEGLLRQGTSISLFGMDGRLLLRQVLDADSREALLETDRPGQLFVVVVEDPARGQYWRRVIHR